ncbi:MAG: hypothetical protein IT518_01605 [Burkholderiales bacterium]|nr:hypothetical protein [Burkholderiales bacterium]
MVAPDPGPVPPASGRRVVVVAGMHRAGTSVVARGLQALGVDLGDRLMAADPRMNERGFFEDEDIVGLDDALLAAVDADWKNCALLADVDWRGGAFAAARAEAHALMAARLDRAGCFGFKDPRVPRLLPFWQAVFAEAGIADAYVIAVRHPRSVIDSLAARDGLDVRRSGWLWLVHLLCALRYTAGRPRVVVDYDNLLEDPARELGRMARVLDVPPSAVRAGIHAYASEFLSPLLRHSVYGREEWDASAVPPLFAEAHALAQRLACDADDVGAAAIMDRIDALHERMAVAAPLLAYVGSVERVADEVPRLTGELAWARASLAESTSHGANLGEALAVARRYSDSLAAALARKERELVAAHGVLARLRQRRLGRFLLRSIERQ